MINVDETILNYADTRKLAWSQAKQKFRVYSSQRLNQVSLIVAMSSNDEIWARVNQGLNSQKSIHHFLLQLADKLDEI